MRDYKTRAELYGYTERRIVIDVDNYSRYLLNMGDIFPPDPYGVYNVNSGECIADFGKAPYTVENGKKYILKDWRDFDEAKGDIFDHHGMRTLTARNHKRVPVAEDRPVFFKAKEAAASYFSETFYHNGAHVILAKNIKSFKECVYLDIIEESNRRFNELRALESAIVDYIDRTFEADGFKEKLFHRKSGLYMVDVLVDIRLKEYYENKFDEEDRKRDEDQERQYNGRHIHCS